MDLYIIFGQRKESYEGEHAPEALDIITEWDLEGNPEWLDEHLQQWRKDKNYVNILAIKVEVNQLKIRRMLLADETLKGTVVEDKEEG